MQQVTFTKRGDDFGRGADIDKKRLSRSNPINDLGVSSSDIRKGSVEGHRSDAMFNRIESDYQRPTGGARWRARLESNLDGLRGTSIERRAKRRFGNLERQVDVRLGMAVAKMVSL